MTLYIKILTDDKVKNTISSKPICVIVFPTKKVHIRFKYHDSQKTTNLGDRWVYKSKDFAGQKHIFQFLDSPNP